MENPVRKPTRLGSYNYSQPGYYFITICTQNKKKILGNIVGHGIPDVPYKASVPTDSPIDSSHSYMVLPVCPGGHTLQCASAFIRLSEYGKIVDDQLNSMLHFYNHILLEKYVVMPNHIHLLLQIHTDEDGRPMVAPTASRVVQQLKGAITKRIGHSVWQKLFHDYVIRGEADYLKIWTCIDNNPARWAEDCFYPAEQ